MVPALLATKVSNRVGSSIRRSRIPGTAPCATVNWSMTAIPRPALTSAQTVVPKRARIVISYGRRSLAEDVGHDPAVRVVRIDPNQRVSHDLLGRNRLQPSERMAFGHDAEQFS